MIKFDPISLTGSKDLYILCRLELDKTLKSLENFDSILSYNYRQVGMHKFIKNLISNLDVLYTVIDSNSISSILTINRMIIDHYAIFYLLTSYSTEQERDIRYYLFLLDGIETQSDLIKNFSSKASKKIKELSNTTTEKTIDNNEDLIVKISGFLILKNTNQYVSDSIIKERNWKFKDPFSNKNFKQNSLTWIEMYNISRIPEHYSYAFQKYYSGYVHGLGMSIMKQPESNSSLMSSLVLSVTSIIQSLIIKILHTEYAEFLNQSTITPEFDTYMNMNWERWNKDS